MVDDRDNTQRLLQALSDLESMYVSVGVLSSSKGELLTIANVHEFGCNIKVTDKLRGYFAHEFGVHLKKSKRVIRIPERSFVRSSFDQRSSKLYDKEDLLVKVIDGELTAENFYNFLGEFSVGIIKEFIVKNVKHPPNSSLTLKLKSPKSNPLVNTGRLISSIAYEVRRR